MMAAPFYVPSGSVERLQFLHLLTNMLSLSFFFLLDSTHPDRREALFNGLFGVRFLDVSDVGHLS